MTQCWKILCNILEITYPNSDLVKTQIEFKLGLHGMVQNKNLPKSATVTPGDLI